MCVCGTRERGEGLVVGRWSVCRCWSLHQDGNVSTGPNLPHNDGTMGTAPLS